MKVMLTKANTFTLEPGRQYLVLIISDDSQWTGEQKDLMNKQLSSMNMKLAFLPKGTRYKVIEANNE